MSGFDVLDQWIAQLRGLKDGARRAAELAAPLVEAEARRTAAAGTTPTGEAWAPRKKDGGRAMVNAATHVTARAVGSRIVITLTGPDVFHHRSKSHPRQVIPDVATGGMTPGIAAAVAEGCRRAVGQILGGAP